jgi:hypothetical protein
MISWSGRRTVLSTVWHAGGRVASSRPPASGLTMMQDGYLKCET